MIERSCDAIASFTGNHLTSERWVEHWWLSQWNSIGPMCWMRRKRNIFCILVALVTRYLVNSLESISKRRSSVGSRTFWLVFFLTEMEAYLAQTGSETSERMRDVMLRFEPHPKTHDGKSFCYVAFRKMVIFQGKTRGMTSSSVRARALIFMVSNQIFSSFVSNFVTRLEGLRLEYLHVGWI